AGLARWAAPEGLIAARLFPGGGTPPKLLSPARDFPERSGEILWTPASRGGECGCQGPGGTRTGDIDTGPCRHRERSQVVDMKFEVAVLPVAGADRPKPFYQGPRCAWTRPSTSQRTPG